MTLCSVFALLIAPVVVPRLVKFPVMEMKAV